MPVHLQHIQLDFAHRTCFTRHAFDVQNRDLIELLPLHDHAKILVLAEQALVDAYPALTGQIATYFATHAAFVCYAGCFTLPGGETAKADFSVWQQALGLIAQAGVDRHSYVIAIGGGAFLDVIGFAAATAHRGVRLVRMPSTTLSQADSGVGVKNGINFAGQKNYLGTFAVPRAIVNDRAFLHGQPHELKIAGLAEAVKVALVKSPEFFTWLSAHTDELAQGEETALEYAVERSAILHTEHIATGGDAFEMGTSRPLDFGHWSAHFLESMSNYGLGHAHAVAIGVCLDALYSAKRHGLPAEHARHAVQLMHRLGLPVFTPLLKQQDTTGALHVLNGLATFREHLGGTLTVLMLQEIGKGVDVHEIDTACMSACIEELEQLAEELCI